jgi:integrase
LSIHDLFRPIFSGVRINEARHVTWADVNFAKGQMQIRITKNGKARWVPFNQSLRGLLEQLRAARTDETPEKPIMRFFERQKSIDRAAKLAGVKPITHHDLRHLFATRCIENDLDISTVSRWLGHQDGGALCMSTFGHLSDEHSANKAKEVAF